MAVLTQPVPEDGAHWYDRHGNPCHTQPKADGKGVRNTTLADARKLGLAPSFSGVVGILDKGRGLRTWSENHIMDAAKATRRTKTMGDGDWRKRVRERAEVEMSKGREFGTAVHDVLEHRLLHGDWPQSAAEEHVWAAKRGYAKLEAILTPNTEIVGVERTFCCVAHGFGGTIDLLLRNGNWTGVLDWKTKTTKGRSIQLSDDYRMQTPSYAFGIGINPSTAAFGTGNIFISRDEPDREAELFAFDSSRDRDYLNGQVNLFLQLQRVWCQLRDYWPQKAILALDPKEEEA